MRLNSQKQHSLSINPRGEGTVKSPSDSSRRDYRFSGELALHTHNRACNLLTQTAKVPHCLQCLKSTPTYLIDNLSGATRGSSSMLERGVNGAGVVRSFLWFCFFPFSFQRPMRFIWSCRFWTATRNVIHNIIYNEFRSIGIVSSLVFGIKPGFFFFFFFLLTAGLSALM